MTSADKISNKPITITDVRAVSGDSAFLIDDGKTAILYDTGFAFTGSAVIDNIKKVLGNRPLDYILLTHSHYDHVLGVPSLLSAYPNVKVVAGVYAARIFTKASAKATMCELNRKAAEKHGLPPADELVDQLKVDIAVTDGDVIACGDLIFTAIELPGHTKCSVGYYLASNKLLLGTETLGIYFGKGTCLPSFLVGYQMALDSFHKIKQFPIESMLLPHYGVLEKEDMQNFLEKAEAVTKDSAQKIVEMFRQGKTDEEMLAYFTQRDYIDHVRPTYPIDAFRLNTGLMIQRVKAELVQ